MSVKSHKFILFNLKFYDDCKTGCGSNYFKAVKKVLGKEWKEIVVALQGKFLNVLHILMDVITRVSSNGL